MVEERPRDYFSRSVSSQSKMSSPHIAYQEKSRQPSRDVVDSVRSGKDGSTSRSGSATASPYLSADRPRQLSDGSPRLSQLKRNSIHSDKFKLQDVPRTRRVASSDRSSKSEASTPRADTADEPILQLDTSKTSITDTQYSTPRLSAESSSGLNGITESPQPAQNGTKSLQQQLPMRGDSLDGAKRAQTIPRKELHAAANIPQVFSEVLSGPTNTRPVNVPTDLAKVNGGKVISGPMESSESQSIFDAPNSPQRSTSFGGKTAAEAFIEPRAPPLPPQDHARTRSRNESITTMQLESQRLGSPSLPRYSAGGDFTMDEDMARILAGEEPVAHESFLRRVSNSVRHGRSYSDKGGRMSRERWPKSPVMPTPTLGQEISSPSTASPETRDEVTWFKNELRRERQKTLEREKKIAELEAQLDSAANIKQVNSELKAKRSTMVVLDTQKEMVIRELEILTEHIASVKNCDEPLDVAKLSNAVLRDFAEALENLKNSFAPLIEDSIQKRNELVAEVGNLTSLKDKSFLEFEQLSSKNAQLAELNNQLVHQIQELYKANSGQTSEPVKGQMNGLGIYSHHKDKSQMSIDSRIPGNLPSDVSIAESGTTLAAGEAEPVTVIQGPHVVNIRKAQPKKFDWRTGAKVAKGVTKGLKGAFSSSQQNYGREMQFAETGAYGGGVQGQEYGSLPRNTQEPVKQGFGFFGAEKKTMARANGLYATQGNASTPSLLDASTRKSDESNITSVLTFSDLYGSELEHRADYEKTTIPNIVLRCIEEVENRGLTNRSISFTYLLTRYRNGRRRNLPQIRR